MSHRKVDEKDYGRCVGEIDGGPCNARHWSSDDLRWAFAAHRCVECGAHYSHAGYMALHATYIDTAQVQRICEVMSEAMSNRAEGEPIRGIDELNIRRPLAKMGGSSVWTSHADALEICAKRAEEKTQ